MSKTSPENISLSSQVFFTHNNPVFKPGFILKAQYKACDYDSAVDDTLQGTCLNYLKWKPLLYEKERSPPLFQQGPETRRTLLKGHFTGSFLE